MTTLNYRHLYYFWVVAKEGGFARAAERLDMAIQTISAQVKALEQDLGHQLLKPAGRGVAVTDAGQAVLVRAEEIFQLGQLIPEEAAAAASVQSARLAVGLSDGLSKLAAHVLLLRSTNPGSGRNQGEPLRVRGASGDRKPGNRLLKQSSRRPSSSSTRTMSIRWALA